MPVKKLPSHQRLELPKSNKPYVVHNPCQGEGQFELNGGAQFDVAPGASVSFTLNANGVITNTGNVELTVAGG